MSALFASGTLVVPPTPPVCFLREIEDHYLLLCTPYLLVYVAVTPRRCLRGLCIAQVPFSSVSPHSLFPLPHVSLQRGSLKYIIGST